MRPTSGPDSYDDIRQAQSRIDEHRERSRRLPKGWGVYIVLGYDGDPCTVALPSTQLEYAALVEARRGDDRRAEWDDEAETAFLHLMAECQRMEREGA